MNRLLKLREVREILSVHKNTLSAYIKNRKLPVVIMPGGAKRVDESDLMAFIESRKFGNHSQPARPQCG